MEWNKVDGTERPDGPVLVINQKGRMAVVSAIRKFDDGEYWGMCAISADGGHAIDFITHWMPLPEPPKQEQ